MAYVHLNLNPRNRNTTDCTVRAIALAMNMSWDEAFMELANKALVLSDTMDSNSTWGTYLKEHGWIQKTLPNTCPYCYTVEDFCEDHPYGLFIVATGSHVLVCWDGNYIDTSDSGNEILTYYFYKGEDI